MRYPSIAVGCPSVVEHLSFALQELRQESSSGWSRYGSCSQSGTETITYLPFHTEPVSVRSNSYVEVLVSYLPTAGPGWPFWCWKTQCPCSLTITSTSCSCCPFCPCLGSLSPSFTLPLFTVLGTSVHRLWITWESASMTSDTRPYVVSLEAYKRRCDRSARLLNASGVDSPMSFAHRLHLTSNSSRANLGRRRTHTAAVPRLDQTLPRNESCEQCNLVVQMQTPSSFNLRVRLQEASMVSDSTSLSCSSESTAPQTERNWNFHSTPLHEVGRPLKWAGFPRKFLSIASVRI